MDKKGLAAAQIIDASRSSLASLAVSRMLDDDPHAAERYSSGGFADLVADTDFRFAALAEALACGEGRLLTDLGTRFNSRLRTEKPAIEVPRTWVRFPPPPPGFVQNPVLDEACHGVAESEAGPFPCLTRRVLNYARAGPVTA